MVRILDPGCADVGHLMYTIAKRGRKAHGLDHASTTLCPARNGSIAAIPSAFRLLFHWDQPRSHSIMECTPADPREARVDIFSSERPLLDLVLKILIHCFHCRKTFFSSYFPKFCPIVGHLH